jgi:hypothetical protein
MREKKFERAKNIFQPYVIDYLETSVDVRKN